MRFHLIEIKLAERIIYLIFLIGITGLLLMPTIVLLSVAPICVLLNTEKDICIDFFFGYFLVLEILNFVFLAKGFYYYQSKIDLAACIAFKSMLMSHTKFEVN